MPHRERTSDPEWQLLRSFLAISFGFLLVALANHAYFYIEDDAWGPWAIRAAWIPLIPLLVYARRRWHRFLRDSPEHPPETAFNRYSNRVVRLCVGVIVLVSLLAFTGQVAVLVNAFGHQQDVITIAGPVLKTTHSKSWAKDTALIRSAAVGDVRMEVPRSVAAATRQGSRLEITVQRGSLGILYYTDPVHSVRAGTE